MKVIRFALIVCSLSMTIIACKTKNTPLTETEVTDVINRFDKAWREKNLHVVDSVLSPAYIYFTQSGSTFNRDSVVQTAGSPTYTLDNVERSEYEVTITGNTAIVSTRWRGKGNYRGVRFDEDQRCSITIIKENNKVQILTEHCTPIKTDRIFH